MSSAALLQCRPEIVPPVQGKLDDGSPCEVQLEVEAVDEDVRASAYDIPLLAPRKTTPVTAAGAVLAAAGSALSAATAAAHGADGKKQADR